MMASQVDQKVEGDEAQQFEGEPDLDFIAQ